MSSPTYESNFFCYVTKKILVIDGVLVPVTSFLYLCKLGPFKTAERVIKDGPIPCDMRVRFRLTLSVSG